MPFIDQLQDTYTGPCPFLISSAIKIHNHILTELNPKFYSVCKTQYSRNIHSAMLIVIEQRVDSHLTDLCFHSEKTNAFDGLFSRTTWVSRHQKGKTIVDLNKARDDQVAVASARP